MRQDIPHIGRIEIQIEKLIDWAKNSSRFLAVKVSKEVDKNRCKFLSTSMVLSLNGASHRIVSRWTPLMNSVLSRVSAVRMLLLLL